MDDAVAKTSVVVGMVRKPGKTRSTVENLLPVSSQNQRAGNEPGTGDTARLPWCH